MSFGGGRREAVLFVLLFLPQASVPELGGRGCSCRQPWPDPAWQGSVHPLPSLPQEPEPIMTILQVFQMERSDFSAPVIGTALPLWMINPHHLSHTRGSEHPHKPALQLILCIVTACFGGWSTSVPCKGLGTSYP